MPKKAKKGKGKRKNKPKRSAVLLPDENNFLAVIDQKFDNRGYIVNIKSKGMKKATARKGAKGLEIGDKILVAQSPNDTKEKFMIMYQYFDNDIKTLFADEDWNFDKGGRELDDTNVSSNNDELDIDDL